MKRYLMVGDEELVSAMALSGAESEALEAASANARSMKQVALLSVQARRVASDTKSLRSLIQSVKAVALEKTGWNRKAAARLLKVSYRTVLYKIEQYQMTASDTSPYSRAIGCNRGSLASVYVASESATGGS